MRVSRPVSIANVRRQNPLAPAARIRRMMGALSPEFWYVLQRKIVPAGERHEHQSYDQREKLFPGRRAASAADSFLARRGGPDGHAHGLRNLALRRVHRGAEWQSYQKLQHVYRAGQWRGHCHHRGTRDEWEARSHAGSVLERARIAV